jgi:hypothetical protein
MRGLLPPLFARMDSYSDLVRLSQVYLEDSLNHHGQMTLALEGGGLSISGMPVAQLQPQGIGLFLFLFRHANRARGQQPFFFEQAYGQRYELADCLEEAGVGTQVLETANTNTGLSTVARAISEEDWPPQWQQEGDDAARKKRRADLNNAFTKLHKAFKDLWPNAGCQVYNSSGRGHKNGPSRWVDIDPARLRVIE